MSNLPKNKWNEQKIEKALKDVMEKAKITTMPTHSLIKKVTGSYSLSVALTRHGGTKYWAKKMGLEIKACESELGYLKEDECMEYIINILGFECEKTQIRYPYDLIVNRNIKIDVKCGNLYKGRSGFFYTFNLEKSNPTCDIFVCYCIKENKLIKTYIIPSCVLSGKTQLSIGENSSKYDKYINKWDFIKIYNDFYNKIVGEV